MLKSFATSAMGGVLLFLTSLNCVLLLIVIISIVNPSEVPITPSQLYVDSSWLTKPWAGRVMVIAVSAVATVIIVMALSVPYALYLEWLEKRR